MKHKHTSSNIQQQERKKFTERGKYSKLEPELKQKNMESALQEIKQIKTYKSLSGRDLGKLFVLNIQSFS